MKILKVKESEIEIKYENKKQNKAKCESFN
jgi:hypothetical protein